MPVLDGRQHVKTKLLDALDSITTAMVKEAKKGRTAQLKLLWELGKLDQDATATEKHESTLSSVLMHDLREKQRAKLPEK